MECKHLGNTAWQDSGGKCASKWGLFRYCAKSNKFIPLFNTSKKGNSKSTREKWQAQNLEHRHPVLIKFTARFLQKYATPYFAKVLIAGNKKVKYL